MMRSRNLLAAAFGCCLLVSGQDYRKLNYPPLKAITIPEPVVFTMANGMRVYLLEDHNLPLVSGSALVRTGNLFDPPDKRGLADLTGAVMRSGGTKGKTGDALDEELEGIAASVEASIGESSGSVSFACLKENTDQVMAIFRDVMVEPEFRQERVDLAKTQARSGISRRNDDAGGVASREFSNTLFGRDTPWGWMIEYEHIDRIARADMQAFHRRYFFPKNIILSVYGDFKADEMRQRLERIFSGWKVEQPAVPAFPPVKKAPHPGIFLAERDDVTQTFFEIGHLGGLLSDKDYPALQVAGNILGSGFTSRLVQTVRTKLGYAYAVSAGWGAGYLSPGTFEISGSTKSSTTTATIRVIREEVEKLRREEVTEEELKTAKDSVLNSFVFAFDKPSKTLSRLVAYEYFGYPKDFIFRYQKALEGVTRADVLRVAKEYFRVENFTIVAVGNPKEFGKETLESLQIPVSKIDLTIPEPPKAASPAGDRAKAVAALRRAQEAMGGAAKLEAVKDQVTEVDAKFLMGAAMAPAKQKAFRIFPDTLRQEQQLPFGNITVFSDGKAGWLTGPQGSMPLSPPILQQVKGEMFRNLITLVLSDRMSGRTVAGLEDGSVEISDGADGGGNKAKLSFDPATGLPRKLTYSSMPMQGAPAEVVETYSAWRAVNEVMLPFEYTIDQGGTRFGEAKISSHRLNTGLKTEELSKKP